MLLKYVLALLLTATVQAPIPDARSTDTGPALLGSGHAIFVRPVSGKDLADRLSEQLREWGRWTVVDHEEQADMIMRLALTGSDVGKGSIVATIIDARTSAELWKSKKQTGHRTIVHNYENPYNRALPGLLEQIKSASTRWPK